MIDNKQFTAKPVIIDGTVEVEVYYKTRETWQPDVDEILDYLDSKDDSKEHTVDDITEGVVRDWVKDQVEAPGMAGFDADRTLISISVKI